MCASVVDTREPMSEGEIPVFVGYVLVLVPETAGTPGDEL